MIDGEQKIVAGTVYRIHFKLGETSCDKSLLTPEITQSQTQILKNCRLTAKLPILCSVSFDYRPWMNEVNLISSEGAEECSIQI